MPADTEIADLVRVEKTNPAVPTKVTTINWKRGCGFTNWVWADPFSLSAYHGRSTAELMRNHRHAGRAAPLWMKRFG